MCNHHRLDCKWGLLFWHNNTLLLCLQLLNISFFLLIGPTPGLNEMENCSFVQRVQIPDIGEKLLAWSIFSLLIVCWIFLSCNFLTKLLKDVWFNFGFWKDLLWEYKVFCMLDQCMCVSCCFLVSLLLNKLCLVQGTCPHGGKTCFLDNCTFFNCVLRWFIKL